MKHTTMTKKIILSITALLLMMTCVAPSTVLAAEWNTNLVHNGGFDGIVDGSSVPEWTITEGSNRVKSGDNCTSNHSLEVNNAFAHIKLNQTISFDDKGAAIDTGLVRWSSGGRFGIVMNNDQAINQVTYVFLNAYGSPMVGHEVVYDSRAGEPEGETFCKYDSTGGVVPVGARYVVIFLDMLADTHWGAGQPTTIDSLWFELDPSQMVADLSVALTGSPNPVPAGDSIRYTATIYNAGPAQAAQSTLTINLPSGITNISAPGNCAINGVTLTCNVTNLPSGGNERITIDAVTPPHPGSITASASVTLAGPLIENNTSNNSASTTTLTTGPEIGVSGNGQAISTGDSSPNSADGTEFGDVWVAGGRKTHTFTIANTGSEDLHLTGAPVVSLASGDHFIVTAQPGSSTISGGSSTTFEITFDPTAAGRVLDTVSIANDDSNEAPYTFVIAGTGTVWDAPLPVTTFADEYDSGDTNDLTCSLREAVQAANTDLAFGGCPPGNGDDIIELPAGTYALTRSGVDDANEVGDLDIVGTNGALTFRGDSTGVTKIDGTGSGDRVAHVLAGNTLVLDALTVTGGNADLGGGIYNAGALTVQNSVLDSNTASTQGGGLYNTAALTVTDSTLNANDATKGGGIHNAGAGTLLFENSTLTSNTASSDGGGLYNTAALTVMRSTLHHNTATSRGGGIHNAGTGVLVLENSTLSGNTANSEGGGLYNASAVAMRFTTLAYNESASGANVYNAGAFTAFATLIAAPEGGANCDGDTLTSAGYNRISDDTCLAGTVAEEENVNLRLYALDDTGGPTLTHAPLARVMGQPNPVLDVVPASLCATYTRVDQRGQARPQTVFGNNLCDAGAVELFLRNRFVCGPPLDAGAFSARCKYTSIAAAIQDSVPGDNIVVSGIVTETVVVTRSVVIRGPRPEDITPGTHMGIVQAAPGPGIASSSVFSIPPGVVVTIYGLNIRHGNAAPSAGSGQAQGGGINNAGELILDSVTLYANHGDQGGALYNEGTLTVINSTLSGNEADDGVNVYNAAAGTAVIEHSTLDVSPMQIATSLYNANVTAGSVTVGGAILSAPGAGSQCTGDITSADYNLRHGGTCFGTTGANDAVGDPLLGALHDNGGPTLTRDLGTGSPAIDAGPPEPTCAVTVDQRGRGRPAGDQCDIGAVEVGARTLTVCDGCTPDPDNLLFDNVQTALHQAMLGDTVALEAGAYTGPFVAYRDVTLQHAGVDVDALAPETPVDVRAILQGSVDDLETRYAALNATQTNVGDPVLTIHAYTYPANTPDTPVAISGDVSVTLQDLTVRYGLSRRGGGITNLGHLHLLRTTVAENAAVNELHADGSVADAAQGGGIYNAGTLTLERSTLSGNRAGSYGGGLYNQGASASDIAQLTLLASTLADNQAAPAPDNHMLVIAGLFGGGDVEFSDPITEAVSGDRIRFHNQIGNDMTLSITPAGVCNQSSIDLTAMSISEEPLICYAGTTAVDVTLSGGSDFPDLATTITIRPPGYVREAHALYGGSHSKITATHSILVQQRANGLTDGATCQVSGAIVHSGGYNMDDDSSCRLNDKTDQHADPRLGPLQDNNQIDFSTPSSDGAPSGDGALSGYAHTHALLPDSPAIDQIPPETCGVGSDSGVGSYALNITSTVVTASLSLTGAQAVHQGDVVQWANARAGAVTLVLNDGQADAVLVSAAAGASSRQVQFTTPGDHVYTVYDDVSRERLGQGTITVLATTRAIDQRGVYVPQRGGTTNDYACDIGAYELQPWIVGEALPRPPSAVGDQAPLWYLGLSEDRESLDQGTNQYVYHAWNGAALQDIALRPSPDDDNTSLTDGEMVSVDWRIDPDPLVLQRMTQVGIIVWPDTPQLHVAGVPVNLAHDGLSDDYQISEVTPFKGRAPDQAASVLSAGIFTRSTYASGEVAYTVLNWGKATQGNAALQVQVVKTVDWNTPGVRDMRQARTTCDIGITLAYGAWDDVDRHEDPEEKSGYILSGDAYDGARTTLDMARVQNTVGDLIPPAHNRETREGPIIPVLNLAPTTFANPDPVTGGHDLRVAWFRPDARNVAWPVKAVGYRCEWPEDPPEIVIASELGSEIGGQPVLDTAYYKNPTVYHQPDPDEPGYSLNDEHALLTVSNLGNDVPALYALRTDLTSQPYALLKYLDPREEDKPKIAVYAVVLTRTATAVTNVLTDAGTITVLAENTRSPLRSGEGVGEGSPAVTLRVGDADLPAGGTAMVSVEALGARALRSVNVTVQYDPATLIPTRCETNRQDFVEDLSGLSLSTNAPRGIQPMRTVRLRANLDAGTDAVYTWNFGDGVTRIAGAEVSHVYGTVGTYTVRVMANNGHFAGVSTSTTIEVTKDEDAIAGDLPEATGTGCRIEAPGELTLVLQTWNKHGLSGNLLLANLSFSAVGAPPASDTMTDLQITSYALQGPAYESLEFGITAGNPIYAPVPMQGLLDMQPCTQTIPADIETAQPFWRDFKGKLWARAAGSMEMLYFYPLQTGFYLDDTRVTELGLGGITAEERVGKCIPWMHKQTLGSQAVTVTVPYTTNKLATHVLPVAYSVIWPPLPDLLSVGETVYERAKGGVSGVANQLAVARIYDDYAPGQWDNDAGKIVITGTEVQRSLAQLIDPVGEITMALDRLPDVIQTERLLFGGGLAIVGNKDDRNLALPFSLRSRILYDDVNGELIFRGYYDGSSAAYLKGDPLLLLNVMSPSDRDRLLALCPKGKPNCDTYQAAIETLYHKTHNPRQLDLCRTEDGKLADDDPEPATNHVTRTASMKLCYGATSYVTGTTYYRDGKPDHTFLISVQDANDDGIPEPYEGLGKGKALSAGNAAGVGYITLAYNNDPSAGDLPVSLQVIKVGCTQNHLGEDSTYRGNVLVVQSDNVFDEKLTLRHTGDFGGRPDAFEFEWWLAPVDDTGVSPSQLPSSYPWQAWTRLEPGMSKLGPEITLEGATPTTLSDNWLIVRYKGYPICGNAYRWSAFAGDPSAKPSEVRAQLAEGWIKRVTNALNPFDTRVTDFVQSPVNTNVDMVRQAGPRYEGPIAFNGDPDNLNSIGLIEAYQTVLDRGRSLSIDSNINHQGANAALLNVSTRIAALYMLLGNDAYMDALDPIVGLGTSSALGTRSPTLFSFMNQFNASGFGLIDEELALLRGRDETLGGVAAAPTYNRLTWNFTNGDGEVAYVTNYNIKDYNQDGLLDEADAALMFPQGHGDAWGHYLTAIKIYYELLRHPSYTWIPRAEPISVAGAPLVADYYDERRFASAAVNKARAGADIVDLTYRKQFADPDTELYTDLHVDASDGQERAWGTADWAKRAGQGAYFDWVVGNAILPPIEERYTDVRKIDRTTVSDLGELTNQYASIQDQLDKADNNMNPLGLAQGAVLFDLNPALANSTPGGGQTHFEQVYDRAIASLGNAQLLFDYANEMKLAERKSEETQRDFVTAIIEQDTALINEMIELFGYPYDADIGVNGTYPEGYEGPDIYNYDLWDRTELTDFQKRCAATNSPANCAEETETYIIEYKPMTCLGFFVGKIEDGTVASEYACSGGDYGIEVGDPTSLAIEHRIGTGLDAGYGRFKPVSWPEDSKRAAPGQIQNAIRALYQTRAKYELAVTAYHNHAERMEGMATRINDRYEVLKAQAQLKKDHKNSIMGLETAIFSVQETAKVLNFIADFIGFTTETVAKCVPQNVGVAVSAGDPAKCIVIAGGNAPKFALQQVAKGLELSVNPMSYAKGVLDRDLATDLFQSSTDYELRQLGREMGALIRTERELRLAVYLAADQFNGAKANYDQVLNRGYRKLAELIRLRQRWAGQISERRYNDMAYRIFQDDALQRYRQQFDLAHQYTYLVAAAYDYETNLAMTDAANGNMFLRDIAVQRSLGELRWLSGVGLSPIVGSGGLAGSMAQMRDNFAVLKGQLGFNNPQYEANRFSLRRELLRLRDSSDTKWQNVLNGYYVSNFYANDDVARLAKLPYGTSTMEPGLVIPFGASVIEGQNFFGRPLGPGDSSYDATQFATKIAAVGVWFDGYDTTRLAETPRVYLLPAGSDVLRPRNSDNRLRYWNVAEQLLPLPYTLGEAEMADPSWIAGIDGLDGQIFASKPYARLRAYPYTPDFVADQMNTDTRLIGRSVWNTRWVLVIPGSTLLADSQQGIERFIEDVNDIYIYFQTYAYAGTQRQPAGSHK